MEADATPYVGLTIGLRAIATRTDGSVTNVTLTAAWSSSDASRATVTAEGRVTVHADGPFEIRATVDGITGRVALEGLPIPTITGRVVDRISGAAIDGSTIHFEGPLSRSAPVTMGSYAISLVPGQYQVLIDGPSHVEHRDRTVDLSPGAVVDFSVLKWGSSRFGAVYDEAFHQFFHQVARVSSLPQAALRKWVVPPSEIYVVEGAVPAQNMAFLNDVLIDLVAADLPALWCGFAPSLRIVSGPDVGSVDGRIVVRPALEGGATGSLGPETIRSGTVTMSFFNRTTGAPTTRAELRGTLLHEFYHVAFGYHLCGGNIGPNPFGYGPGNCPFPDSVMANNGVLVHALSAQDRLAACLVYHPDTTPANAFPDINR